MLRLSLHPDAMAPRIVNLAQWQGHLLDRLGREAALTGDAELAALREELLGHPGGIEHVAPDAGRVVVPLRIRTPTRTWRCSAR